VALLTAGCFDETSTRTHGLVARCTATVITPTGAVTVDVETDYLPHVVQCENGAAAPAALEAQAVAARSFLYYRLAAGDGTIGDGQGDQVYTCGKTPGPEHAAAVRATSGLVLRYRDTQLAAFYVAGALQQGPECVGGIEDPTGTEVWVTYNDGKSGDDVTQTQLGFVDPSNHANRGCLSQNGSDCLAGQGRDVVGILRFYYGADIGIEQASGPCVDPIAIDPDAGADGGDAGGCTTTGAVGILGLAGAALLFWRRPKRRRARGSKRRSS